jgi:hypothetical protein
MTSLFSIAFWICNFCLFLLRKSFFDSGVKRAFYPFLFLSIAYLQTSQSVPQNKKISAILSYLAGMHIKGLNPRSLYYGGVAGN